MNDSPVLWTVGRWGFQFTVPQGPYEGVPRCQGVTSMKECTTHVVVLGAGPAGLATAHELSRFGVRTTVLERNPFVGGLSRTVKANGFRFDLGGHRWFTKNEALNEWFRRLMANEYIWVDRVSRVYYDGRYFQYPIEILDIARNTGAVDLIKSGLGYMAAVGRSWLSKDPPEDIEEAYVAQFGRHLYQMFFEQYTEKVWGLPCKELSADWVSQRSRGISITSLLKNALTAGKSEPKSLAKKFMYPRLGYERISQRMAEDVEQGGNQVVLNANVSRIEIHGNESFEVVYRSEDGEHRVTGTHVVSTIPLGVLARILSEPPPDDVREAAEGLSFRDLVTVNLEIDREQVSDDTWVYVQDRGVIFGRLHEPKNWSAEMVPSPAKTSLVLECFCTAGDEIWSLDDATIARRCISDLDDKVGMLESRHVAGWTVVRTRQAYPVYDLQYAEKISTIKRFLARFPGLEIVGRGGTFRYNNADHSIEMGLLLGQKIMGFGVDPDQVNTDAAYQEIKQVGEEGSYRHIEAPEAP